jgi:hypothetical protein
MSEESRNSAPSGLAKSSDWDTVFAIHTADANIAIRTHNANARRNDPARPVSLSHTSHDGALNANFGDWQIINEGGDDLICFELPLTAVKIALGKTDVREFAEGSAKVEINFGLMPPPPHPATKPTKVKGGTRHALGILGKKAAAAASVPPSIASVLSLELKDNTDKFLTTVAGNYLEAWMNDNLEVFDAVLGIITLNTLEDAGQFAFLRPIYTTYAFAKNDTGGVLGVLCLTEGSTVDPHSLPQQVSPAAIPPGHQSGFLISRRRLLADLLLPELPKNYPGTEGCFFLNAADVIELTQPTACTIITADGESHSGTLDELHVSVQGTRITIEGQTTVKVSEGIHSRCRTFSSHTFSLVNVGNGSQTIAFGPCPEFPDNPPQHEVIKDDWVTAVEIFAGLIAAIITAVAATMTGGAAGVLAGVVVGMLVGGGTAALAATPEILAAVGTDDAPTADILALNIVAPITWPNSNSFLLTSADLSDSLRLAGKLWDT